MPGKRGSISRIHIPQYHIRFSVFRVRATWRYILCLRGGENKIENGDSFGKSGSHDDGDRVGQAGWGGDVYGCDISSAILHPTSIIFSSRAFSRRLSSQTFLTTKYEKYPRGRLHSLFIHFLSHHAGVAPVLGRVGDASGILPEAPAHTKT